MPTLEKQISAEMLAADRRELRELNSRISQMNASIGQMQTAVMRLQHDRAVVLARLANHPLDIKA